jgi:hypothetical protein
VRLKGYQSPFSIRCPPCYFRKTSRRSSHEGLPMQLPSRVILVPCPMLQIRPASPPIPAFARTASTPARSNRLRAQNSFSASVPPAICPIPNIPACPSSPAPATNRQNLKTNLAAFRPPNFIFLVSVSIPVVNAARGIAMRFRPLSVCAFLLLLLLACLRRKYSSLPALLPPRARAPGLKPTRPSIPATAAARF